MSPKLADVPAPRSFALLVLGLIGFSIYDRIFLRTKILSELNDTVMPATHELAEYIHDRQVVADEYSVDMKVLNETMVKLSRRVYWLTVVAAVAGVVAAAAGVVALVS